MSNFCFTSFTAFRCCCHLLWATTLSLVISQMTQLMLTLIAFFSSFLFLPSFLSLSLSLFFTIHLLLLLLLLLLLVLRLLNFSLWSFVDRFFRRSRPLPFSSLSLSPSSPTQPQHSTPLRIFSPSLPFWRLLSSSPPSSSPPFSPSFPLIRADTPHLIFAFDYFSALVRRLDILNFCLFRNLFSLSHIVYVFGVVIFVGN